MNVWDTKAQYDAGFLTDVDTAYSPDNVVLAINLNTGTGGFDNMYVTDTTNTDWRKSAVSSQCAAGTNIVSVPSDALFFSGDEVLIIQMTGTGAGNWEIAIIQQFETGKITLTTPLSKTYYADANSKSQVIMVPQYKDVIVENGGTITCQGWNGSTGGIVMFRSTGTVEVQPGGKIDVEGKGFDGGAGGSGGSEGNGGPGGATQNKYYKSGHDGGTAGTGGTGGGSNCHCGSGGDGALRGYDGGDGNSGNTGSGPAGGASDQGGYNFSSADLSVLQVGSGGGGGAGGHGGYGGGGHGGGGGADGDEGQKGAAGSKGGTGGTGGNGGKGSGAIIIFAKSIVVNGNISASGATGNAGNTGNPGHDAHVPNQERGDGGGGILVCGGSGGGGGGGAQGGTGGNGGGGGAAGVISLTADNIALGDSLVTAVGGTGIAGGSPGSGGSGQEKGYAGGNLAPYCPGNDGNDGPQGPDGNAGSTGTSGSAGKIRLNYRTMSGTTTPAPSYVSGLYYTSGSLASDVFDTGTAGEKWRELIWEETLSSNTNISFEVRASDTVFDKNASVPAWIARGSTSPVITGLPSGRYMQWRATLTSTYGIHTPVLHKVMIKYSQSPEVTTHAATDVQSTSALLHGKLDKMGTSVVLVNTCFEWGTSPGGPYPNTTDSHAMGAAGAFSDNISSLTGNTTYYYRTKADGGTDGIAYGAEMNFTSATIPPSVTTRNASSITAYSAVINGNLSNMGTAPSVNVNLQWGTNPGIYPNATPWQILPSPGGFNASIEGLAGNTIYYYRAVADGGMHGIAYGTMKTFTTSKVPPSAVTFDASNVAATSAKLNGALASKGTAPNVYISFQYGTASGAYTNETAPQVTGTADDFSAQLTSLVPDTTVYFRIKANGMDHGTSYGIENSFHTLKLKPLVSTNSATPITYETANLNGDLVSKGSAPTVNVSFQWGSSPGLYLAETDPVTMSASGDFHIQITGLANNTRYYYRARADGGVQDISYGAEKSFLSATPPSSAAPSDTLPVTSNDITARQPGSSGGLTQPNSQSLTLPPPVAIPNIIVQSASLSAAYSTPGVPVTVTAQVVNRGNSGGQRNLKLFVNGQEQESFNVALEEGQTTTLAFNVNGDQPGIYHIYLENLYIGKLTVEIDRDYDIILYISSAIILISLIMAVIYIRNKKDPTY